MKASEELPVGSEHRGSVDSEAYISRYKQTMTKMPEPAREKMGSLKSPQTWRTTVSTLDEMIYYKTP